MFATIDIGTNSVLLLIGEAVPDGSVRVVEDRAMMTRLGEGLGKSGEISGAASKRTLDALSSYWELCVKHGVRRVAAIGTAALRNARNAADFLLLARRSLGLEIEIISFDREATLTFASAARDFGDDIVVIDIGGGSTEFVSRERSNGKPGPLRFRSLNLGCVSLTEEFIKNDPPSDADILALRSRIRASLKADIEPEIYSRPHDRTLVATAGTATTLMAMHLKLATYDPALVHGGRLKIDDLRGIVDAFKRMTLEERKRMPGLIPERADVILAGACLLHESMSALGFANATISDRGVKWGLFYEEFCGKAQA
ncbi:MAG: Ppx/GppA family phosphatase [Pseudomonadota bacterium]